MCVFMGVLCVWDQILVVFGHKDICCRVRNRMLDKIVFKQSHVVLFFYFFIQHVSLTLFHLCPRGFKQSTFSTNPWWYSKESCF